MSRAQPRRGDGEAPRKHFSFVLDLGCFRRVPRKNPEADTAKGAHMCALSGGGRGVPVTEQRVGRRKK